MNLRELGECGFIRRIQQGCLVRPEGVLQGIGDDAAAFRTDGRLLSLVTTDVLVENVHFLRHAISGHDLGHKSLAVNLSDIAAMGGTAREAFVSIAIPDGCELDYLEAVFQGMKYLARTTRSIFSGAIPPSPGRTWSSTWPSAGWSPKTRC